MSDEGVVKAVSAANVQAHVEHITTEIPSRLAGSANGKRMAEYSAAALTKAGVSARVHEMPGLVSFPGAGRDARAGAGGAGDRGQHAGPQPADLPDGISAELMDVASGAFSEYEGRDATGKITLSELSYHPARHEKQRISAIMGATGCVMMNWGHPENTAVPFGSVKPVWGNPTPETYKSEMATLPCVGIARTAGLKLREMLKAGPVRVWFRANVENGWRPRADHGRRGRRAAPTISWWSAATRTPGPARRRPTTPPATPASWSWRGCSSSTATSCGAASSAASGPATRPAP